jgi:Fur family ferric uptake transcriptional regulator
MSDPISKLSTTLEEKGYRLTAARQAILDALVRCEGHISADDLVTMVHLKAPGVGRMTVYRTLDLLTELGLIRPVFLGQAAAHYILMDQGHHHHMVCTGCNRIIEFDLCVLKEIEKAVGTDHAFKIEGHLLEIYGRCQACR